MRRVAMAWGVVLLAAASPAPAAPANGPAARAAILFMPAEVAPRFPLLFDLAEQPGLALGLTSPTVGGYSKRQMALDISQGSRVSTRAYRGRLKRLDLVTVGSGGRILRWREAVARARAAPGKAVPGLLADTVRRSGAHVAFAGVVGFESPEAIVAADRAGRIDRVSLGTIGTFSDRALALWRDSRLLVARLPPGESGAVVLTRLLAARRAGDLVYVMSAAPEGGLKLLPTGVAGLPGGPGGVLTSKTTRREGLLAAIDVAPTVLGGLSITVPGDMKGLPAERRPGGVDDVDSLGRRLGALPGRRGPALRWLVGAWLALAGAGWLAARGAGLRVAARVALVSAMWLPATALAAAALRPSRTVELAVVAGGALALSAVGVRLGGWRAAAAVAAAASLGGHAVDFALGSPLTAASLTGPNPRGGARFYGAGNELEAILSMSVVIGAGAALARHMATRAAGGIALACVAAALVLGPGRLGADVGAVIALAAAAAAAALVALAGRPGGLTVRRVGLALGAPALALAALAAIDLATGGGAHLTRSILEGGPGDLVDAVRRRLGLSAAGLRRETTVWLVSSSVVVLAAGVLGRRRILGRLGGLPGIAIALQAGLAATLVGALANDSGPLVLVVGTVFLGLAVAAATGGDERDGWRKPQP